jgi:hypothetical protein
MKKYFIFFNLLIFTFSLKAQELLNKEKKDIIRFVIKNKGEIRKDIKSAIDMVDFKKHDLLIAVASNDEVKRITGFPMSFYLRDDKCYKYTSLYEGKNLRKKLINQFNSMPQLVKSKQSLIWVDRNKKFEIKILEANEDKVLSLPAVFSVQIESISR